MVIHLHINITGDYNDVMMTQRTNSSSSGHQYWLHVEGDNNDIYTVQREGGSQYINLDIYNDGNDVDLRQTNAGDHYMSVILRGTQPTDISVIQNGWNNKSYSITNYCYTSGGCTVNVTKETRSYFECQREFSTIVRMPYQDAISLVLKTMDYHQKMSILSTDKHYKTFMINNIVDSKEWMTDMKDYIVELEKELNV